MKNLKVILLYLLIGFYLFMGIIHFIQPQQYLAMMPEWLPVPTMLIYFGGLIEIILAILLMPIRTRAISAKLIIAMLIVFFFMIHIPQSIGYYKTNHQDFVASLFRLPIQFLFIGWAWLFVKDQK